jgi:hypothetical protein
MAILIDDNEEVEDHHSGTSELHSAESDSGFMPSNRTAHRAAPRKAVKGRPVPKQNKAEGSRSVPSHYGAPEAEKLLQNSKALLRDCSKKYAVSPTVTCKHSP